MVLLGVHWSEKVLYLPQMTHNYMELQFNLFVMTVTCLSLNRQCIVRHTAPSTYASLS
jgi:hypothetical protein